MKAKSLSRVRLSRPYELQSLPGSSVHGSFQARVLEWVASAFSTNDLITSISKLQGEKNLYLFANSQTQLSDLTFTFHFHALEKEMATHSSVLAWRIPGTGEPGGLPSVGSHRVRHD